MWGLVVLMLVMTLLLVAPAEAGKLRETLDAIGGVRTIVETVLGVGFIGALVFVRRLRKAIEEITDVVELVKKESASFSDKFKKEMREALDATAFAFEKIPFLKRLSERLYALERQLK